MASKTLKANSNILDDITHKQDNKNIFFRRMPSCGQDTNDSEHIFGMRGQHIHKYISTIIINVLFYLTNNPKGIQ